MINYICSIFQLLLQLRILVIKLFRSILNWALLFESWFDLFITFETLYIMFMTVSFSISYSTLVPNLWNHIWQHTILIFLRFVLGVDPTGCHQCGFFYHPLCFFAYEKFYWEAFVTFFKYVFKRVRLVAISTLNRSLNTFCTVKRTSEVL